MKGKVFSSSQDLYQDQAKILFDFYKDAAEKIVSQEEELEKAVEAYNKRDRRFGALSEEDGEI